MKHPHRKGFGPGLGWLLAALAAGAPALAQDATADLQALEKELMQEYKELRVATREAADDEAASAVYREFEETILPDFGQRFAALAKANRGSDVALGAWSNVVNLATQGMRGPLAAEALQALTSDHLKSPELRQIASNLRYAVPAIDEKIVLEALQKISSGSPLREVQAMGLYCLGAVLGEDRAEGDARLAEAKAVFAKLGDYADLELRKGQSFSAAAQSFLFALENLVVGKDCPNFTAVDAEGAAFQLADYKGKVVLVDFWGFW